MYSDLINHQSDKWQRKNVLTPRVKSRAAIIAMNARWVKEIERGEGAHPSANDGRRLRKGSTSLHSERL